MVPWEAAVAHQGPLPQAVDVAIIGGGIAGVMTAYFLARKGQRVLLAEKGRIAGEQSGRNWGWIRSQGRDLAELPIMVEANRLWRELAALTDVDIGLRQGGIAYLARGPKDLARYERFVPQARALGLDTRMLTSAEAAALMPASARRWPGGMVTPSDLQAEPWLAVPALARLAAAAGVTIREGLAVRALDLAGGRVAGIVTEAGRVKAGAVVLAGGAWSGLFLGNHGIWLPQLSVRATVAATQPLPLVFAGGAHDDRLAWRRRADGGYTLAPTAFHELFVGPAAFRAFGAYWPQLKADPFGMTLRPLAPRGFPDAWGTPRRWGEAASPFEAMRVLDPAPHGPSVRKLARDFADTFPALGEVRFVRSWAGLIDTLPDVVPVVGPVDPLPGLFLLTGLSGHGFGIGPGVGRVMADLVLGNAPGHDLTRFRFRRFAEGGPLEIGPAL